jgi:predicted exporter
MGGKGSVIMLKEVKDPEALVQYETGGVFFMDKLGDLNSTLVAYRFNISLIIAAAYLVLLVMLAIRYGPLSGVFATLPPLFAVLTVLAIFGYTGVNMSFFHITALFLVLCFGMDYTVFQMETKGRLRFSGVAVMLSCFTTLASFGLLAFTSFEVTKSLGLTLFLGIMAAYLYSLWGLPGGANER